MEPGRHGGMQGRRHARRHAVRATFPSAQAAAGENIGRWVPRRGKYPARGSPPTMHGQADACKLAVASSPRAPATMRSMESSISCCETVSLFRRPARMAASFSRLARSAPANPGVRSATSFRSTLRSRTLVWAWTCRMARRSCISGIDTITCECAEGWWGAPVACACGDGSGCESGARTWEGKGVAAHEACVGVEPVPRHASRTGDGD